jgi:hypothetical protein
MRVTQEEESVERSERIRELEQALKLAEDQLEFAR